MAANKIRVERDALYEWAEWVEKVKIHECSDHECTTLRDIKAYAHLVLDDIRLRHNGE
jgi:hypothetical protein